VRSTYGARSPIGVASWYVVRPFQLLARLAHVLFWRSTVRSAKRRDASTPANSRVEHQHPSRAERPHRPRRQLN
jgi:hypothetical protein